MIRPQGAATGGESAAGAARRVVSGLLAVVGGAALIGLMAISVTDALLRTLFDAPVFGAPEIVRMLLAATVAFSIPAGILAGQAITIDIVADRLPRPVARAGERVMLFASAAILLIVAWRCLINGLAAASFGEATILLSIPYQPFYHCLALGFAVSALGTLAQAVSLPAAKG